MTEGKLTAQQTRVVKKVRPITQAILSIQPELIRIPLSVSMTDYQILGENNLDVIGSETDVRKADLKLEDEYVVCVSFTNLWVSRYT
jgi:hypothetical protein